MDIYDIMDCIKIDKGRHVLDYHEFIGQEKKVEQKSSFLSKVMGHING
jgi:hypothetical protein